MGMSTPIHLLHVYKTLNFVSFRQACVSEDSILGVVQKQ